ncbi:MAG TPA: FAD-dependent oxidoreductase [Candidatus Limnocylindrales bacterium]|nr:FAD-dependent oxidoreductase [Candidatus Limnocylindrales bacterium]
MKTRAAALDAIASKSFDLCVIGAGATGAGCALDAQLRGLKTVLLDAGDFGGVTSSASTKIVHGGVRYLEQAFRDVDAKQYRVVRRALHERIAMLNNAPYLARRMEFVVPCYRWLDVAYLDAGLKLYDWIAGKARLSPSRFLSRDDTLQRLPALKRDNLVGSVVYADGQFDDARYSIALVESFAAAGGETLNYARVIGFDRSNRGKLAACAVQDTIARKEFAVRARAFVNATGPFADSLRTLATPGARPRMRLSKGSHILLPLDVMPGHDAMLIPKTEDGRVLFAVPWMGRLLVGTTEQEVTIHDELYVTREEVTYLLRHLNQYLATAAGPEQIVSGFAGARPLVSAGDSRGTKKLARDHEVEVDAQSGLISIMGGKWTTYRAMAVDTIDAVQKGLGVEARASATKNCALVGCEGLGPGYASGLSREYGVGEDVAAHLTAKFGSGAAKVLDLAKSDCELATPIVEGFPALRAEAAYTARTEMAVTIEDVLSRRLGIQPYSWRLAIQAAPAVASILGSELGWNADDIRAAAEQYMGKIKRLMVLAGVEPE